MTATALKQRIEESGDRTELAPDHMLPVQFTELLLRPAVQRPELRLMAAVLEDAIRSFCRNAGSRGLRGQRLFRETAAWFASDDVSWPFAFENVCDALALEPEWIRQILARWQQRDATTARRATFPGIHLRVAGSRHSVTIRPRRNGRPGLRTTSRRAAEG
jgi:hypothetical protein